MAGGGEPPGAAPPPWLPPPPGVAAVPLASSPPPAPPPAAPPSAPAGEPPPAPAAADAAAMLAGCLGALPLLQAGGEGLLDQVFRLPFRDALDVRHLADDEVLGALVHLLLAERQALALADQPEVLQHLCDLRQTASLHL